MKTVLRRNGNKRPTIPLAQAVHMKETYANIQVLLKEMCYEGHRWNLGADMRVLAALKGLQGDNTKFCCLLCERDSRAWDWHHHLEQRFSIVGPRPGAGPWHQLNRAARDSPGIDK